MNNGRIVVLLYDAVATGSHPKRHNVVADGLHNKRVKHEDKRQEVELPAQQHSPQHTPVPLGLVKCAKSLYCNLFLLVCQIPGSHVLRQIRDGKPPKDRKWDCHGGHHDENQSPSWQVHISTLESLDQPGLNPAPGHLAEVSEPAEDRRPRTQFGLLVPGAIDEVRAHVSDGRECTLKGIEDEDLPNFLDTEGHERENTPDGVRRDKDIARFSYGEKGRRRDLEDGVEDEVDCRHVIVVFALRGESGIVIELTPCTIDIPGS